MRGLRVNVEGSDRHEAVEFVDGQAGAADLDHHLQQLAFALHVKPRRFPRPALKLRNRLRGRRGNERSVTPISVEHPSNA